MNICTQIYTPNFSYMNIFTQIYIHQIFLTVTKKNYSGKAHRLKTQNPQQPHQSDPILLLLPIHT